MPGKKPCPPPEQSCPLCNSPDNSMMVSGDECLMWYHFDCVGVTHDIANHEWRCSKCRSVPAPTDDEPDADNVPPIPTSPQVSFSANGKQTDEGAPTSQLPAELQLQLLEEECALERRFLRRKYQLMMTIGAATAGADTTILRPQHHSSPLPPRPSAPILHPEDHLLETATANEAALLNQSQIAARHAVSKELPIYSGNPEEWPLFIATFENTTRLCGYTSEENMARLQRCLKGKALEAVRCQLLHPSNLGHVMSTLKMLFGRPEIIVYSLVQKINQIPSPRADKLNSIVDFALAVRNMVATVQACNLEEHLCNISLLQNLVDRLPPMIKLTWATHRQNLRRITLTEFSDWLYTLAEAASMVTVPFLPNVTENNSRRGRKDDGFINAHSVNALESLSSEPACAECTICQGSCTSVESCKQFARSDHSARWALLREHKLCRCCLRAHRGLCKFGKPCGKNGCLYKHHRLLHNDAKDKYDNAQLTQTQANVNSPSNPVSNDFACNTHRVNGRSVLFKYLPVTLYNQGLSINTYAFIDCGSSLTLLEESLATELNLHGEKHPLCLRWTAYTCRYEDSSIKITMDISGSRSSSRKYLLSDVYTVKELNLPTQSLSAEELSRKYSHLKGIPVDSYVDVQPRILIGMNNIRVVHPLRSREGNEHEPIAAKTRLGWMVYGTSLIHAAVAGPARSYHICSHSYNDNVPTDNYLDAAVKNYFALESLGIVKPEKALLSSEDERAMKSLRCNTILKNGRYQTSLLWKYDDVRFPDSKPMAIRRHHCLMKRLQREPKLGNILQNKIADYITKGYIRKLTPDESMMPTDRVWYLPIFPVFNLNKPGKVRIVWDAAATVGGVSLNSVLLKGPDLLTSLPSVLYKFRERRVAICGDIREMYHQVLINDAD
ncbi:uncharacterized protein LOC131680219 [Topomyia yanbarensis]|uniref:uncharacterized protein LOC131680219 n=1 Tax=Topomyia yanbarensis TaxID=2498891 RepID=UPI00273A9016|nr:uncharacterized protein LOC131680219 [Topomyia yanbarensis]